MEEDPVVSETKRLVTPAEHLAAALESKERYAQRRKQLSFEEKLRILVKLQEKAYAMGKTKVKPWPVK